MASEATPRINYKYLQQFLNQTVRILGKVVSLRGETAIVDANGHITIFLNRVRSFSLAPPPYVHKPPPPHPNMFMNHLHTHPPSLIVE